MRHCFEVRRSVGFAVLMAEMVVTAAVLVSCQLSRPANQNASASFETSPTATVAGPGVAADRSEPVPPPAEEPWNIRRDRKKYNEVYEGGGRNEVYNHQTNAFLLLCLDRIEQRRAHFKQSPTAKADPPRTAIDLGMGDGRNTIPLAQRGYRAVGIDVSDVGVERARQRAAEAGVSIDARVADVGTFEIGTEQWDVIVMMYFGIGNSLDRYKNAIKPDGYIIIEHTGVIVPSPVLSQFWDWHVLHYECDVADPDWKWSSEKPRLVERLMARKP